MSHTGRLLVATPLIGDPNFERTVVLVLRHDENGAFGVVLNRPSDVTVAEVLPAWAPYVAEPGVVFRGGPVGGPEVTGIGRRTAHESEDPAAEVGRLGIVDPHRHARLEAPRWSGIRLFAGSAGWAAGQLEDEIAEGAWWVFDAAPDDPDSPTPERLWHTVVRRQGGETAWFANCPLDPTAN